MPSPMVPPGAPGEVVRRCIRSSPNAGSTIFLLLHIEILAATHRTLLSSGGIFLDNGGWLEVFRFIELMRLIAVS